MKPIKIMFILIVGSIFCFSNAMGQCVTDDNTIYSFTYGDSNYEIVKENKTWTDAAACAVERGGKLAEISSQEEQDSVFYYINLAGIIADSTIAPDGGGASYLWLGGNDMNLEGTWVWNGKNDASSTRFWQGTSSGSVVNGLYNNWGNEPDDYNGQDGLGIAFTDWPLGIAGQWNDVDDSNVLFYIIEFYHGTTNITEFSKEIEKFSFYPNPGNDKLTVIINRDIKIDKSITLKIYHISGKVLQKYAVVNSKFEIDITKLSVGTYVLALESENTIIHPQKLTVIR